MNTTTTTTTTTTTNNNNDDINDEYSCLSHGILSHELQAALARMWR